MEMEQKKLGNTDISLTTLGVGGYLGALEDPQAGRSQCEAAAVAAVRRAVDLGVGYFDTSPAYGEAERHLGLGLRELSAGERAELTVSTKVGTHPERPQQYDADSVRWSLDRSLELLFCEGVDIVFVHDPTSDDHMDRILAPGGAVDALEKLKQQGAIRAIGLGVRKHRFLQRAIDSERFDAILPSYDYHPLRTTALPVIELAAGRGMGVVNGSPYNAGLLAGIDLDVAAKRRPPQEADLVRARQLSEWCRERCVDLGVLAVQFSLRCAAVHATLVGPRTAGEVEENIRHATTELLPHTWIDLDAFVADLQPPPAPGGESAPTLA